MGSPVATATKLDAAALATNPAVQFNMPSGLSSTAITSGVALALVGAGIVVGMRMYQRYSPNAEKASAAVRVATLIVIYSLCSSSLLIINKVAVTFVPAPSFVLFAQLVASAAFVKILASANIVEAEPFKTEHAKPFIAVVIIFVGFLYCNVKALQYVPVDTIICFRASIPLVVAVAEYFTLGRELPSLRSWFALVGVLVGAIAYTYNDIFFNAQGYFWVAGWYALCVVDALIMKHVADQVKMTTWSRTLYNNAMAAPLVIPMAVASGELSVLMRTPLTTPGIAVVLVSCGVGLAMNFFSWKLREAVSATSVTVIGNICKFLTILANILIWNQHSSMRGTVALIFCLGVGLLYKQSPMRAAGVGPANLSQQLGEKASYQPVKTVEDPVSRT